MNGVIISESFIVKDSLTSLFCSMFKTENIKKTKNLDLLDKVYLSNLDFIFMDTTINYKDLLSYAGTIKKYNPLIKILVLDFSKNKELFSNMVKLGVDGYILNILDKDEFIYIINRVISGKKFYDSELLENNINSNSKKGIEVLTNRESCVLRYVSKGLSNRDIANSLSVTDYTIKKHVSSILTKLNLRSRQDIIIYAKDNNLLENSGL